MGFNVTEIVESKGFKLFMGKLYGIGAAVVIIGALFKIQHWPGAGIMLIFGLGTEAIIFFISAFEPPHEEVDWTLAYPELAGIEEDEEEEIDDKKEKKKNPMAVLSELFENADIGADTFQNLGAGLGKLNDTTKSLNDLSDASVATNEYVSSVRQASQSMGSFAGTYSESANSVNQSADALAQSYTQTADVVTSSASKFAELMASSGTGISESYQQLMDSLTNEISSATSGNKEYSEQLGSMTKNLSALNAVYELQLQGSNEHLKASEELYSGLDSMMESLKASAGDAKKYQGEVAKLGNNLSALNTVYGNMLAAMNISPKSEN